MLPADDCYFWLLLLQTSNRGKRWFTLKTVNQVKVSGKVGAARQESLLELVLPKCMSGELSQWCSEEL